MNKTFTSAPLFLTLLSSGIISYTMESTFELLALPSELNQHISSYTDPKSIGNLSITCHRLHEKISFQTPHIWDIVRHSIDCISDNKMPQLLLKVRLCKEYTTSECEKKNLEDIDKKILTRYDPTESKYQRQSIKNNGMFFAKFLENQPSEICYSLYSACFSNDTNIVTHYLCKNDEIDRENLFYLRESLLNKEHTISLEILYKHYASLFEQEFTFTDFRWNIFVANVAMLAAKYKSFEMLINHHKKYLNRIDINNMTYLDFLLAAQEEGPMKHFGAYYYEPNGKTMKFDLNSIPMDYIHRYLLGQGRNDLIVYYGAHEGGGPHVYTLKGRSSAKNLKKYKEVHDKCVSIVMDHGGTMTTETPEKCPPCIRRTSSKH